MTSKGSAILFFSYSVSREAREKKWYGQDMDKNRLLASALVKRTCHVLNESGLPVYHIHEGLQKGETFAERFNNAFGYVFDMGYDAVIALGNDTPDVNGLPWASIKSALRQDQPVIGPNVSGGIYLCGLTRDMWDQGVLTNIPWKTNQVFKSIVDTLGQTFLLPVYHDLNNRVDIRRYFRESDRASWLIQLLATQCFQPEVSINQKPKASRRVTSLRAPPEERISAY